MNQKSHNGETDTSGEVWFATTSITGRQTEEIQRRAPASVCHTYTSQTVTTNPFRLSPETWQQPSGKRSSVSSPAQGM